MTDHSAQNENSRLQALAGYDILDTEPESGFDDLTRLAAQICQTPAAFISLIDENRQWFKSCFGFERAETARDVSFCAHTILDSQKVLIVEDAAGDERFRDNPAVTGAPHVRFYAGAPLVTPEGFALGSLCVIDYVPRRLEPSQVFALEALARQAVSQLELSKTAKAKSELAENLQQLIRQASDGIYLFEETGKITSVNDKFCELTGRTPEQLINTNISELLEPAELKENPIRFDRLREGKIKIVERKFVSPDGSEVFVEISAKKINDNVFQGIARDITERKTAEQKLLETERRFRDFLNGSLAFFCTHDLEGTIQSVSPAAAAALGYEETEIVGKNFDIFLLPEARDGFREYLKQLADTGKSRGFMRVLTKTGELRVWSFSNIVRTDASGAAYVLGSSQDVTELKLKEKELRKSENMFRSFINNSPTVIFLKGENGCYEVVNRSYEELLKVKFENFAGKTDFEIFPQEIAEVIRASDLKVLETGQPLKVEEFVPASDGTPYYWLTNKFCFEDEAGKKHVGGVAVNITERKQMEEELKRTRDAALESARLKSSFLTNVSHEIRSPMNGIMGMSDLLLETPLDRTQRDYALTIQQSGEVLLTVINDILDLGKIESGKLRFENIDFDVRETIDSTVEMLAERAFRKNIEVAALIDADVPRIVSGDPGRLRQVLTNLLSNAVKFTEQGEISVRVKIEKQTKNNFTLRFAVTDTGIGIHAENIKKLFQPFVQVDNSTTRVFGGTGLGLAISKQIVQMMHGDIGVESEPLKGSTFSFTASFAKPQSPRTEIDATPDLLKLFTGKKILIADKAEIIRQSIREYVSIWNVNVVEAGTGEEVLREVETASKENAPFDAVIIDVNLPDWEGFALARRIKDNYAAEQTQIVLTTAYGQRGDAAQAKTVGAAGYLIKPIRMSQFFDCLAAVFKENSADQNIHQSAAPPLITRHSLREAKSSIEAVSHFPVQDFSILVVDDNEVNRRLVGHQLTQLGLNADMAFDGAEALEKTAKKDYQVILMDCQMPRLDGYEATREIRRRESEKLNRGEECLPVSIIALTAHTFAGERERCLAAGMNDYLPKPVRIKELTAALEFWAKAASNQRAGSDADSVATEKSDFAVSASEPDDSFDDEIRRLFLTETERHIAELEQAIKTKDAISVARFAHAARGNALSLRYDSLAETLRRLETAAKDNDLTNVSLLFKEFLEAFELLKFPTNIYFNQKSSPLMKY